MSSQGRRLDHWRTSMDVVEALRTRIGEVDSPHDDPVTRALMARVAHAKASSFIALLHADGRVLDVNPAALIAGGVDRAEVVGVPLWAIPWWAGGDPETARALERAVDTAAQGRFARFDVDVRAAGAAEASGPDAAIATLDLSLRPLRGQDGQVAFIVAEGRPITDRKRAEERIARQNAELSALTERLARVHDYRERLLGDLSHDLRAPLRVIVTRAEQALHDEPSERVRRHVTGIRLAALGALEQVDDMLEQVKADHGEARLALVDADLGQAVRTVAAQFEPLAADRDVALAVRAAAAVPARFDVERVSRVVSNLLANAIRHTPPGGRIRVELSAGDGSARLEVADSGPGVPPEHSAAIWGRYRSGLEGDGRSAGAGAGLGLAIVREFVELHGGEVALADAPEGGALFAVTLPLAPPEGPAATATLAQLAAAAQRTEYVRSQLEAELSGEVAAPRTPTVVIVERVRERAEAIVEAIGDAAVTCATEDAVDGLRLAVELRPDAVVVGTSTGDAPPTSLLRRLARDERLAAVRRLALAGEREEDASVEALEAAGAELVLPAAAVGEIASRLWATPAGPATRR